MAENEDEIELDEMEVDGRHLSEGTITTLLTASRFDGHGFVVSFDHSKGMFENDKSGSSETACSDPNPSKSQEQEQEVVDPSEVLREAASKLEIDAASTSESSIQKAYCDVVRTLKRNRESRTPSRHASHEDSLINNFFSQVEIEDTGSSRKDNSPMRAATTDAACCDASSPATDQDPPLPSEDPLKPHLPNIQIRVDPEPGCFLPPPFPCLRSPH
jgi:hypothetical protein